MYQYSDNYKLNKYLTKLKTNELKGIYFQKIFNLIGGSKSYDTIIENLPDIIRRLNNCNKQVTESYNVKYNSSSTKKYNSDRLSSENDDESEKDDKSVIDDESVVLSSDGSIVSFIYDMTPTPQSDQKYLTKKQLSDELTDHYLNKNLNDDEYHQMTLNFYNILDKFIDKFKKKHNLKDYHIQFFYKGGNTNRIFETKLYSILSNYEINIDELIDKKKFKKSDFDTSIYVSDAIYNKSTDNGMKEIAEKFDNLILLILNIIKYESNKYFKDDNLNNLIEIAKSSNDDNIKNLIKNTNSSNDDTYKLYTPDEISKIKTIFKDKQKQKHSEDNGYLQKLDFIYGTSNLNIIKTNLCFSEDTLQNNSLKKFQSNIQSDQISILYIHNFKINFFKEPRCFHLFRLKVNRRFKENIKDNKGNDIVYNCGYDLIDITIVNINEKTKTKDNEELIIPVNFGENKINISSIYYLYYDLIRMIFEDTIFPWYANKFDKRLKRFFIVYLYIQLLENKHDEILSYKNLIDLDIHRFMGHFVLPNIEFTGYKCEVVNKPNPTNYKDHRLYFFFEYFIVYYFLIIDKSNCDSDKSIQQIIHKIVITKNDPTKGISKSLTYHDIINKDPELNNEKEFLESFYKIFQKNLKLIINIIEQIQTKKQTLDIFQEIKQKLSLDNFTTDIL